MIDAGCCGRKELFEQLTDGSKKNVFEKQKVAFAGELMKEREFALRQIRRPALMQEPNIKESAGGLRDSAELLWASRIVYGRSDARMVWSTLGDSRDGTRRPSARLMSFCSRAQRIALMTSRRTDAPLARSATGGGAQSSLRRFVKLRDVGDFHGDYTCMRGVCIVCAHLICSGAVAGRQKKSCSPAPAATADDRRVRDERRTLDLVEAVGEGGGDQAEIDGHTNVMAFSYAQATGPSFSAKLQDAIQSSLPVVNRACSLFR